MASFDQKLRTLYLMEILLERTDDEHMLNASELCMILDQEYGISTDRSYKSLVNLFKGCGQSPQIFSAYAI